MRNRFIRLWLIIGLVAGFLACTFFIVTYLNNTLLCNVDCKCRGEVVVLFIFIALTGLFVGSLTYYFVSEKNEEMMNRLHMDISETLKFLPYDQMVVVKALIKDRGMTLQSRIVSNTGLSRVKVSRILRQLEKKGVVKKTRKRMTNVVKLSEKLKKLFVTG